MAKGLLAGLKGHCPNRTTPCDFALYANATHLDDNQKLVPNVDITGTNVIRAFQITSFLALVAAFLLLMDYSYLIFHARYQPQSQTRRDHKKYKRIIHSIDTILHTFSDAALTAGIALAFATLLQSCDLSVYHYNIVCYMLLMAMITHTFAITNIPKWFSKNGWLGALRLAGILLTFCFTWLLYKSRDVKGFPMTASSAAIMPISCYITGDDSMLNSGYFETHNISTALLPQLSGSGSTTQFWGLLIPMTVSFVIGLIFLAVDSYSAFLEGRIGFFFRCGITFANLVVAGAATYFNNKLRTDQEIDAWYLSSKNNDYSFAQLMSLTLLASSVFPLISAFYQTIDGPRAADTQTKQIVKGLATDLKNDEAGVPLAQYSNGGGPDYSYPGYSGGYSGGYP
ncbi:uncharacterized protein BDZ99DRAFT_571424 [Mytilinidion resinicola]|uniref:Uncharacterized protein n=1 Tax=Mytilinidion resinicola TaxID=574789 RepID=A0A6A6YM41_9PEZI|nr:uncharacterized protein BDZ99DRAFT_571424 [Mytilinidion resinicola]KAF2809643.1 hypothetical protein BDZ99DRAFT_571424 [Mytilinidion resinicola]